MQVTKALHGLVLDGGKKMGILVNGPLLAPFSPFRRDMIQLFTFEVPPHAGKMLAFPTFNLVLVSRPKTQVLGTFNPVMANAYLLIDPRTNQDGVTTLCFEYQTVWKTTFLMGTL